MTHRTIRTGRLEIGFLDEGEGRAGTAVLIHGWPDDPHGWDEVAGRLAAAGWRVVRPWLRGWGPTRFLGEGPRTADAAALAEDALALIDALGLERVAVVGHDWGARAAYIAARAAPERITRCAALSIGWGPVDPTAPLPPAQAHRFWYQWYMATDAGERAVRERRRELTRYVWDLWAVARPLDEARFDRMAASFDAPDWADVVLHYYRVRWGRAAPGADGAALARIVADDPVIAVPTLVIHGAADPCTDPATSEGREALFAGPYRREVIEGVGHFPQWEAPEETARLLSAFLQDER